MTRRFRLLPANRYLGWTPYAWLVYLPTMIVEPITAHASSLEWAATIVATVAFVVSYFRGYWLTGRALLWIVAFQTALGVALTPMNPGAVVLFVYACSFVAQLGDDRLALRGIVIVALVGTAVTLATRTPSYAWLTAAIIAPLIGGVNLHFARVGRASHALRLARDEIAHLATVAERERIARDLHDVLGHTLSLITLKSELAAKLTDRDPARAAQEMRDVEQVSRKALQDVREAIRGYRASLGEELARSRSLLAAAVIDPTIDDRRDATRDPLAADVSDALALALREAVTNVVRHAGAKRCRIELRESDRAVHLVLQDDGHGVGNVTEGSGLRGMRERIEALDGTVLVHRGGGTRLTVTVPTSLRPARTASLPSAATADA